MSPPWKLNEGTSGPQIAVLNVWSSPTVEKRNAQHLNLNLRVNVEKKKQDLNQYRNKSKYLENMTWFFPLLFFIKMVCSNIKQTQDIHNIEL